MRAVRSVGGNVEAQAGALACLATCHGLKEAVDQLEISINPECAQSVALNPKRSLLFTMRSINPAVTCKIVLRCYSGDKKLGEEVKTVERPRDGVSRPTIVEYDHFIKRVREAGQWTIGVQLKLFSDYWENGVVESKCFAILPENIPPGKTWIEILFKQPGSNTDSTLGFLGGLLAPP
jgi:hypothetical protein